VSVTPGNRPRSHARSFGSCGSTSSANQRDDSGSDGGMKTEQAAISLKKPTKLEHAKSENPLNKSFQGVG
jgi:hypothetical protein